MGMGKGDMKNAFEQEHTDRENRVLGAWTRHGRAGLLSDVPPGQRVRPPLLSRVSLFGARVTPQK